MGRYRHKTYQPNECSKGDVYINPFPLDIRFLFMPDTSSDQPPFVESDFNITYQNIPAGKYVRLILLAGTPQFKRWIHYRPVAGSLATGCSFSNTDVGDIVLSVKNQIDEEPSLIWLSSKVGINAHDLFGAFGWVYPDNVGIGLKRDWPQLVDLNPVPAKSITP